MKRAGAIVAIGLGCAALVAAQTPTEQTSQPSAKGNTITLIGCLQGGGGSATGTTGTAGGAATPGAPPSRTPSPGASGASFILTNAAPAPAPGAASTAGAAGASSAAGSKTYALEGSSSDLSKDVGKKVEVSGMLDTSSSGASSTAAPGASASSMPAQKLKVSSVRVVGSDCSEKEK
jgi:hypothetical protein